MQNLEPRPEEPSQYMHRHQTPGDWGARTQEQKVLSQATFLLFWSLFTTPQALLLSVALASEALKGSFLWELPHCKHQSPPPQNPSWLLASACEGGLTFLCPLLRTSENTSRLSAPSP